MLHTQVISIIPHETTEYFISLGIIGDINGDGQLNVMDIVLIINQILSGEYHANSDLSGDGLLNILDIIQLINLILT